MAPLVTLLTDFGVSQSYVAEVKAVLCSRRSPPVLIDITHEIPPFAVEIAAFQLRACYRRFPKGSFHLVVVDPGVGSARKCLYVKTRDYHFVGPDNGSLLWAVRDCEAIEKKAAKVYQIPVPDTAASTFHGRDVFAAFIAGFSANRVSKLKRVAKMEGRELPPNEVMSVDRFGNVITSILVEPQTIRVRIDDKLLVEATHYEKIASGEAALIRGSNGFWEIATRKGSAAELLGLSPRDRLEIVAGPSVIGDIN